ncbi:hypothetical protein ACP4OV_014687 [Aristida adscensionis]
MKMGVHKDWGKIAVKRLYGMPEITEKQFQNEFYNLARLQHQNIVRLISYCYEIQKKCVKLKHEKQERHIFADYTCMGLCLEYMENGSLDKYLSEECDGFNWERRYAIIKGICKGLKYLHEELESPIYHLDLKPENILLDENLLPRITDFGLSRLFGEERTQITKSYLGTRGYLPPEYIERNIISNKFDIFSLGVVIIKIMTGPTGYSKSAEMSAQQFIELVHENWRKRLQVDVQETPYIFAKSLIQVKRCIEIALSCVEADRHKRPSIGDNIIMLNDTEKLSIPDLPDSLRRLLSKLTICTEKKISRTDLSDSSRHDLKFTSGTGIVNMLIDTEEKISSYDLPDSLRRLLEAHQSYRCFPALTCLILCAVFWKLTNDIKVNGSLELNGDRCFVKIHGTTCLGEHH